MRRRLRRLIVGLSLLAGCCAIPCTAASAATPSFRITWYFGLKRPEARARATFYAVSDPRSREYRHFLTVSEIAERYGASRATRDAFVHDVRALGLTAKIDPSGVFARVRGTVSRFDRVFHVHIKTTFGNFPNVLVYSLAPRARLTLPAELRPLVQDLVTTYEHSATPSGKPTAARDAALSVNRARAAKHSPPKRSGTWTRGCAQARATGGFGFAQVRHAYGIDRLGAGRQASVAILNIGEGVSTQDIADNARCFGYPRLRPRTLLTDGQTSPFAQGTFEPEEDLDVVRGIAPGLTSIEFSQVWLSPELWFLGASQVLDAPHLPDSFSISYGECERMIRGKDGTAATRAGANLMDALLARLGLAGVGSYASSGDSGSTCDGMPYAGVAWPASSPFVTAVGGTQLTLNRANERTGEVAWNDLPWTPASQGGGASGGGYSIASPRPPYQDGLGLAGRMRATPDVSAAASNFPGWPVVLGGNWVVDGGTSGSAPLIASAMAILSADQQRNHHPRIGPANGLFYWLAASKPDTIHDIVRGTNKYLRKVRGFDARRGYDLVTGLGVPKFAALPAALPKGTCVLGR